MQGLTDLLNSAQNAQGPATAAPVQGAHLFGITLIGATADNLDTVQRNVFEVCTALRQVCYR